MERKEITRTQWKLIVWIPILLGGLVWGVFNWLVQKSLTSGTGIYYLWIANIGFLLIGWGFGLAYARYFKIQGLDNQLN